MLAVAVAAGALIGISLGALGGGGSILTVPALVYLLGQSPNRAVTVSLLVVGIAAAAGALVHARAGRTRLTDGIVFGVLGAGGSYAGSRASAAVPPQVLLAGFGALMLAAALAMVLRRRSIASAARAPGARGPGARGPDSRTAPHARAMGAPGRAVLTVAAATGVGLITGFFGVGGGFVVVPALVLVLGFDMATAAGTSLVVIAINSAAALAARAGGAAFSLDWALAGAFAAAAVAGALAGGRLAGWASPQRLNTAFTGLIVVIAGYTLARSLSTPS